MAAGNRGGFNPYRDHAGRFSGPTGGGGAQINAALRKAAGRGVSGGSSGGGGDSAPSEAQYAAMPKPDLSKVTAASRKAINSAFAEIDPGAYEDDPKYDAVHVGSTHYGDDINGVASHVLTGLMQRGPSNPGDPSSVARNRAVAKSLISAYGDAGIHPEKNLTPKKMLDIFDSVSANWGKPGSAQADGHAIASALSMGDMELAFTVTDGQGAGIGWPLARKDFREMHGLPADGRDEEGQS
ncbi:MAG: hypothetical protein WCI67_22030 [Chloroflexales bacterium]